MENKKHQIFVSSTYVDLIDTRKKVIESIMEMNEFPVGMEMFSAENADQWSVIKRTIDESDYYVVIIGHRYGSIEPKSGVSYTEQEYDYAISKNIPVLAFIRDRDVPLTDDERETDTQFQQKLNKFIEKAQTRMCQFWVNDDDLISKVPIALFKSFTNNPQTGWIRGNQAISADITNELARLSKENNELKEKLKHIENLDNLPKLGLKVNNDEQLIIKYPDNIEGLIQETPTKIIKQDIPEHLLEFITDEEIESYNANLPSKEEISHFNSLLTKFKIINDFPIPINFKIYNKGKSKAKDIFISVEFPDDIMVFREDDKPKIELPKELLPPNPIIMAARKYGESKIKNPSILKLNRLLGFGFNSNIDEKLARTYKLTMSRKAYIKNNNCIVIETDSLLHTLSQTIDEDILICAFQKGTYEIKVSLMCEQYKQQETIIIPVIVE